MSDLNALVVGAGRAGGDIHLDAFTALPGISVKAFCDPDLERAQVAAGQAGIDGAFSSLDQALAHGPFEIISICSPPQFHREQAILAMQSGAHVLLEKPLAMSLKEADAIRESQLRSGRKLCVVHNYKFQRGIQAALEMVHQGAIGDVLHIERTWLRNGSKDRMISDPDNWCHQLPGGRWTETLSHDVYIAYQFMGELELVEVDAQRRTGNWPWLPADEVAIGLRGAGGYCSIRYSANVQTDLYRYMMIHGSKGVLLTDGLSVELLSRRSPVKQAMSLAKQVAKLGLGRLRRARAGTGAAGSLARGTGHLELIRRFLRHVEDDSPAPVSWDEAYSTMRLVESVGGAIEACRS